MPAQKDLIGGNVIHHCGDILAERLHGPLLAPGVGLPMPRQIDCDDLILPGKMSQLRLPKRAVATPAMDKDKYRQFCAPILTADFVANDDAVCRRDFRGADRDCGRVYLARRRFAGFGRGSSDFILFRRCCRRIVR
jgi:hypothetical protein